MTHPPVPAPSRSLFILSILYGGMVCIAGVLGVKQVRIGPLAVEGGIFAFLLLVVIASAVAEMHGRSTANALVRWGFLPLILSALLIRIVLALPADPGMYPPAMDAFPIVVGQSARMMIAGLIAYGVSQALNVQIFDRLGSGRASGRLLCLRGMVASVISQTVDTILFITISFHGERDVAELMSGQLIAKITLSVILVPPLIAGVVALGRRIDAGV